MFFPITKIKHHNQAPVTQWSVLTAETRLEKWLRWWKESSSSFPCPHVRSVTTKHLQEHDALGATCTRNRARDQLFLRRTQHGWNLRARNVFIGLTAKRNLILKMVIWLNYGFSTIWSYKLLEITKPLLIISNREEQIHEDKNTDVFCWQKKNEDINFMYSYFLICIENKYVDK